MTSFGDRPDSLGIAERLRAVDMDGCPCGTGERYFGEGTGARTRHAHWHLEWDRGVNAEAKHVYWLDSLAIVTGESSRREQDVAYRLGRLFQREKHYDFPMVPDPTSWHAGEFHQALIAVSDCRAIGVLIGYQTFRYGIWDGSPGRTPFDQTSSDPIPEIAGIWVARSYRRLGVGTALVNAFAAYADVNSSEIAWGVPFSDDGKALALSIAPGAVRIS